MLFLWSCNLNNLLSICEGFEYLLVTRNVFMPGLIYDERISPAQLFADNCMNYPIRITYDDTYFLRQVGNFPF